MFLYIFNSSFASTNAFLKALPALRRRSMSSAQFLDIVCNQRQLQDM